MYGNIKYVKKKKKKEWIIRYDIELILYVKKNHIMSYLSTYFSIDRKKEHLNEYISDLY